MKRLAKLLRRAADKLDPPAERPKPYLHKPPELKAPAATVEPLEQVPVALRAPGQNCWWWDGYL